MNQQDSFDPLKMIEDHAKACNMTVHKLMINAGMNPSTYHRWKSGSLPNSRTLQRILEVPIPDKRDA